ncbi:kinase-like domain-containing protein [Russula brevipes]|nr:kinase-like domain-containing protein [Russula brevipes]
MKHKHIIQLEDSFEGFAILPKMIPLQDVKLSQACESEVVEVCLGLIQGVAYLHQCNIAHRDIKPDNLVVDREFCLKIIDFDVAMQVKDENEEVDNSCGTKHWMAPEVEKKLRHSPIRADRWACGRVLQYLLGSGRTEGERPTIATLRPIADNLCAYVPKDRPSLPLLRLERSSSIPAGSNVISVIAGADVMTTEAREHAQRSLASDNLAIALLN